MKNKMTREQIEDIVKEVFAIQIGGWKDKISNEANIRTDMGFDSLDIVEVMMEFENRFNIKIPDEALYNLYTINDVINYIEMRIK